MNTRWTAWLAWILLGIAALAALAPLYWMISGSFKLQEDAMQMPPEWFPQHPTLQNYTKLFASGSLWSGRRPALRWLVNSLLVAISVSFSAVATSALAGYALAKKRFRGRLVVFWAVVATMMLPRQVSLMPLYLLIVRLGWVDSYAALIAPYLCFPFGIFLVRQFMEQMPDEMIAAARIDGAGEWRIFWYIVLPMARPALGAVAIFSFMGAWNEYLWQLIVTNRPEMFTLPVGVSKLVSTLTSFDLGLAMAGATVAFLPMLAVFVMFQRYFVKGISVGALKG
ncbi:MAG: sugar ABC transporter permease [Planctomycetaceae bacterium]|nr:sugar ABC transporter permease [Planctomycetaceae bacterium]